MTTFNVELLRDYKDKDEMWFKFTHKKEDFLICVATTDKPFRGVSEIKAVYRDAFQNREADLPGDVISQVYAEVLDESVKHFTKTN